MKKLILILLIAANSLGVKSQESNIDKVNIKDDLNEILNEFCDNNFNSKYKS